MFGMALATLIFNVQIMRMAEEKYVSFYAILSHLSMNAPALYEGAAQGLTILYAWWAVKKGTKRRIG